MINPITFCINTAANEINHIKLLFCSLEKNLSSREHEIIVFIDSDNQNTFEWLLTQKSIFPNLKILKNNLPICYGYARNINEMFKQASNDIVSYLQSDMVICKDYDVEVLKTIQPNTILCSTRIEPPLHGNSGEKITYDFGLDPIKFDIESFTKYAEEQKSDRVTEFFFAPFTLYKSVWNSIGGHDTVFRRSREDSDILTRLVLNGVNIKQTWRALVYHFTCTSSRGLNWFNDKDEAAQQRTQLQQSADSIELSRFITKWGSFNHSLSKVKYYNISAHITGMNLNLSNFSTIQSHFSKVYVDDTHIIQLMQEWYDRNHHPANKLLNISSEDWKEYSYMYNTLLADDRIQPIESYDGNDDILVRFDQQHITPEMYYQFIQNIQQIIDNIEDLGTYEYGPFTITALQKMDRASEKIIINNPEIKPEHLYTIY
jgi:glycosyltransferase involved in cell wall biosynthesis